MTKKILIRLAVIFAALFVGLCVTIAIQPNNFSIQRSATMAAPPSNVFAQVNDLAAWDAWTPWKELDPNPKTTISNPSAGKGATFGWIGNDQIGEGILTILESKPDELVEIEQEFFKPFAGKARIVFLFVPEGDGTKVTWKMNGTNNFLGKAMCLFMNMDTTIGPKFEAGLANIKAIVENDDVVSGE